MRRGYAGEEQERRYPGAGEAGVCGTGGWRGTEAGVAPGSVAAPKGNTSQPICYIWREGGGAALYAGPLHPEAQASPACFSHLICPASASACLAQPSPVSVSLNFTLLCNYLH